MKASFHEWFAEEVQMKTLKLTAISAFLYIIFSLFHYSVVAAFLAMVGCMLLYLYRRFQSARREGIINKLSPKLQKLLLERSIFDVLCDLWYFSVIAKYLKVILAPFILKSDPKANLEEIKKLSPTFQKIVLTKGVLNIFPEKFRRLFISD